MAKHKQYGSCLTVKHKVFFFCSADMSQTVDTDLSMRQILLANPACTCAAHLHLFGRQHTQAWAEHVNFTP